MAMALSNPLPASLPASKGIDRVSRDGIRKAVNALLKWKKLQSKNQPEEEEEEEEEEERQQEDQDDFIYLLVTLKRVPPKDDTKTPHKIPLPHPLQDPALSDFCLIIADRPNSAHSKLTVDSAIRKLKSQQIPISKVLKLSTLKSDFNTFQSKRTLYNSYDTFFADRRVVPLLPKVLGKQFYKKKKKLPVPVDLSKSNWKEQIETACSSALLCLGTGTCSVVRVGKVGMESGEVVENVVAAIDGVVQVVSKGWSGVRSFHLKFSESLALPVYQKLPHSNMSIEGTVKAAS
ncbi:hypothetical protein RJ639_009706 [Escallonia herrerae]|uniref:Ribosomal protein L1 n=1 Tax=Escallonia herrerae TaxID=1293975 RepID=A0AA88VT70_9ASTE|nr:hypothetical protein RJ639_009706 [Escallonia herrerae]